MRRFHTLEGLTIIFLGMIILLIILFIIVIYELLGGIIPYLRPDCRWPPYEDRPGLLRGTPHHLAGEVLRTLAD